MKKTVLLIIFSLVLAATTFAQDNIRYGIKAGLSFSKINGDSEQNAQSENVETNDLVTRFHVGIVMNIDIIENTFGVAPEFMFVQRGTKYIYEDQGTFPFTLSNAGQVINGTKREVRSVANSYLSLPVLLYYKPFKYARIGAGVNFDFLVGSTAQGELSYTWQNGAGETVSAISNIDYNYYTDKLGEASEEMLEVIDRGNRFSFPQTVGAYYTHQEDKGKRYQWFDMGLNADLTLALSRGIGLGLRVNYGLLDITNNKMDLSQQDGKTLRDDKDTNLTYQVSLGFNF